MWPPFFFGALPTYGALPYVTSTIHKWKLLSRPKVNCTATSVTLLLSEVVGPVHLETICSQKGIGQQEAMFYRLV